MSLFQSISCLGGHYQRIGIPSLPALWFFIPTRLDLDGCVCWIPGEIDSHLPASSIKTLFNLRDPENHPKDQETAISGLVGEDQIGVIVIDEEDTLAVKMTWFPVTDSVASKLLAWNGYFIAEFDFERAIWRLRAVNPAPTLGLGYYCVPDGFVIRFRQYSGPLVVEEIQQEVFEREVPSLPTRKESTILLLGHGGLSEHQYQAHQLLATREPGIGISLQAATSAGTFELSLSGIWHRIMQNQELNYDQKFELVENFIFRKC